MRSKYITRKTNIFITVGKLFEFAFPLLWSIKLLNLFVDSNFNIIDSVIIFRNINCTIQFVFPRVAQRVWKIIGKLQSVSTLLPSVSVNLRKKNACRRSVDFYTYRCIWLIAFACINKSMVDNIILFSLRL